MLNEYWTPYHNSDTFIIYNDNTYEWVHMCIDITQEGFWL